VIRTKKTNAKFPNYKRKRSKTVHKLNAKKPKLEIISIKIFGIRFVITESIDFSKGTEANDGDRSGSIDLVVEEMRRLK
jgi:hypothetical protein